MYATVRLPQRFDPIPVVAAYMISSIFMTVANKRAVDALKGGTVLTAAQMVFTCSVIALLNARGWTCVRGTISGALHWAPIGLLTGLCLWAGKEAMKYANISTLTVVSNGSPFFVLLTEGIAFGTKPTKASVASLMVILIGVFIYTWDDLKITFADGLGILFILIDSALVCTDGLLQRYLLALKPVQLSTSALVMIQNLVGLIPIILLLTGPCLSEWRGFEITLEGLGWGLLTLPGGAVIAYSGIFLRCAVSATAALVVSNIDKIFLFAYGSVFMGDQVDAFKICGCILSLLGSVWHAYARMNSRAEGVGQQSLLQQAEDELS